MVQFLIYIKCMRSTFQYRSHLSPGDSGYVMIVTRSDRFLAIPFSYIEYALFLRLYVTKI